MLKLTGIFLSAFVLLVLLSMTAVAVDLQVDYFNSVKNHFNLKTNEVDQVSKSGIIDEELPVVFFIAGRAKVAPAEIGRIHLEGQSWMDICGKYSIGAKDFYMIISTPTKSTIYGPIFDKYNKTPQRNWKNIEFTDDEIVNLVNLKMMSSLHDYSVYEIMAMRDYGKSFLRINQQVTLVKKDMDEKQQRKVLEAR